MKKIYYGWIICIGCTLLLSLADAFLMLGKLALGAGCQPQRHILGQLPVFYVADHWFEIL